MTTPTPQPTVEPETPDYGTPVIPEGEGSETKWETTPPDRSAEPAPVEPPSA